ncbi:MAG: UpxZ family transcription anti-terminator antagonist [Bacteroides intestinalis]|nr:UpxZ family transcription anti-terminator antagonist [Bacteroides intestinalis]
MSDQVSSLFSLAHSLLTLGQDDRPIYVDDFTRLNRDVYESALNSYGKHGSTPEAEAELCLGLLVAFNATMYDNGHKQEYIQKVLDRSFNILPLIPASLLKVRLLTYCYGEVYEEELAKEAHFIIDSWGTFRLTEEQKEVVEELRNIEENPYFWEDLEG